MKQGLVVVGAIALVVSAIIALVIIGILLASNSTFRAVFQSLYISVVTIIGSANLLKIGLETLHKRKERQLSAHWYTIPSILLATGGFCFFPAAFIMQLDLYNNRQSDNVALFCLLITPTLLFIVAASFFFFKRLMFGKAY